MYHDRFQPPRVKACHNYHLMVKKRFLSTMDIKTRGRQGRLRPCCCGGDIPRAMPATPGESGEGALCSLDGEIKQPCKNQVMSIWQRRKQGSEMGASLMCQPRADKSPEELGSQEPSKEWGRSGVRAGGWAEGRGEVSRGQISWRRPPELNCALESLVKMQIFIQWVWEGPRLLHVQSCPR